MDTSITIVSGLPRSGTSLMMQMLKFGGMEVVTDEIRTSDTDNPRGYYEYELVKKIKTDTSWLPATRGKAVKMVSMLLYDLPASEQYRILFMERDLDETLPSQEKMMQRLGRPAAPREQIKKAYLIHLERLNLWLELQNNMRVLQLSYPDLVHNPEGQALRIGEFLDFKLDISEMVKAVDPALYRNRKPKAESV
jgi:Sulfotransferase domain